MISESMSTLSGAAAASAESRLRGVVAGQLGIDADTLAPNVSLVDDLAVDSLELAELALAIERELGVAVPETLLDEVRTYGELVAGVLGACRAGGGDADDLGLLLRVRVTGPDGDGRGRLERTLWLTPYGVETILEDVAHGGRGMQLEVAVPARTPSRLVAAVRNRLARAVTRGVSVSVR